MTRVRVPGAELASGARPRPSTRTTLAYPPAVVPARPVAVVSILAALVVACSGPASAHDLHGGGDPIGFAAVAAVPVLAGLAGGLAAASSRVDTVSLPHAGTAVGVALVALGLTAVVPAVADAPIRSAVLAVAGGLAARLFLGRDASHRGGNVALAAVGVHRFVEGSALAVAYVLGAEVGAVGAVVLAGHAAVETVVIGGLHGRIGKRRALVAVVAVQACFVLGALVGGGVLSSSASARVAVLAVTGGVLLAAGLGETGWLRAVGRRRAGSRLR